MLQDALECYATAAESVQNKSICESLKASLNGNLEVACAFHGHHDPQGKHSLDYAAGKSV